MTSERNRAMRVAYGHARRGDDALAGQWLAVAESFAPVLDRQRAHLDDLLGVLIHPDQLRIADALQDGDQAQTVDV